MEIWRKRIGRLIIICFFVLSIRIKGSCQVICCFFKGFVSCLILSIVFLLMLVSNLKKMPSIACGLIWRKILNAEGFVATWDLNFKILQMNLVTEMMGTLMKIWHAWLNAWISSSQSKEPNNSSTILPICSTNHFKPSLITFTCSQVPFQATVGKH